MKKFCIIGSAISIFLLIEWLALTDFGRIDPTWKEYAVLFLTIYAIGITVALIAVGLELYELNAWLDASAKAAEREEIARAKEEAAKAKAARAELEKAKAAEKREKEKAYAYFYRETRRNGNAFEETAEAFVPIDDIDGKFSLPRSRMIGRAEEAGWIAGKGSRQLLEAKQK